MKYNFDITKWTILKLGEKVRLGEELTQAEELAKHFLEEMGYHMYIMDLNKFELELRSAFNKEDDPSKKEIIQNQINELQNNRLSLNDYMTKVNRRK